MQEFMVGNWEINQSDEIKYKYFLDKGNIFQCSSYFIFMGFCYLETGIYRLCISHGI